MTDRFARAALIGTGMVGGSLALALKAAGRVERWVGFDLDPDARAEALARKILDEVASSAPHAVAGADLVVLAVPVRATQAVCEAIAPVLAERPEVLVTDVGSTKRAVLEAVRRALPFPERFVGGHPIAGTERSGPGAAQPALFRDRRCLLTPIATTRKEAVATCRSLWEAASARVFEIDPELHDRVMAFSSHLPHAVAFALARAVGEAAAQDDARGHALLGMGGGGFIDTTRIAASDAAMWRDIFLANADEVQAALEALDRALGSLRRAVASEDGAQLEAFISAAQSGRARVLGEPPLR